MSRTPITLADVDAYLGATTIDEAFEDALFAATDAGDPAAAEYFALRAGLHDLIRRGTYDVVTTAAGIESVLGSGLRTTSIRVPRGAPSAIGAAEFDADVLIIEVELALEGVRRLDVEMVAGETVVKTIDDVAFEPADGRVFFVCEGQLALAARQAGVRHRFFAVDAGGRRLLHDYGFDAITAL